MDTYSVKFEKNIGDELGCLTMIITNDRTNEEVSRTEYEHYNYEHEPLWRWFETDEAHRDIIAGECVNMQSETWNEDLNRIADALQTLAELQNDKYAPLYDWIEEQFLKSLIQRHL